VHNQHHVFELCWVAVSDKQKAHGTAACCNLLLQVRAILQGLSSIAADGSRGSIGQAAAVVLRELHDCGADAVM
jgi:hypothetical protein